MGALNPVMNGTQLRALIEDWGVWGWPENDGFTAEFNADAAGGHGV